MTPHTRSLIFTLLTLLVLGVSLTRPLSARADEGTPTEAPAPAQDTSAATSDAATAADPAATDQAADPSTAKSSEAPSPTQDASASATEAPVPTDPAATDQATDALAAEPTSLLEVLDQAPQATAIVVLNQAGDAEPLATQQAADIIQNGDPMWCPAGVTVANSTDCVNAGTVSGLITLLSTKSGAGIVYFASTYSTPDATFDGTDSNLAGLTDLTLQGGWDGNTTGTINFSGSSVFSVPLSVINWVNDVAINDIDIEGASGTGLTVQTSGNIDLQNITSHNSTGGGDGAYLDNHAGSGHIRLTGTNEFNGNSGAGVEAYASGDLTANNLTANGNLTGNGARLIEGDGVDVIGSGTITLTGTNTFNDNHLAGLQAYTMGDITLNDVTADGNAFGADVSNGFTGATGSINITGTNEFNANSGSGLSAWSNGNISISNLTADGSLGGYGAHLNNHDNDSTGFLTLTGTNEFNGNHADGLQADSNGDISLNNVAANGNVTGNGARLTNSFDFFGGFGSIFLTGTNVFNDNHGDGLQALTSGEITINDITADGNVTGSGAFLIKDFGTAAGDITFTGTNEFNANGAYGLEVWSNGNITVHNVTADQNARDGAYIYDPSGVAIVDCSTFKDNAAYGVFADAPTLHLNQDTFADNASGDYTNTGSVVVAPLSHACTPTPTPAPTPYVTPEGNAGGGDPTEGSLDGYHEIPVTGSGLADLDCTGLVGVTLELADGDRVILYCPVDGQGSATTTPADQLPAAVSQGTLISALTFNVVGEGGGPQQMLGSGAAVSFVLPAGGLADDYAILYWDTTAADGAGAWVELQNGPLHDPSDDKFVTDAGSKTAGGRFEARVNFTGAFALVRR